MKTRAYQLLGIQIPVFRPNGLGCKQYPGSVSVVELDVGYNKSEKV